MKRVKERIIELSRYLQRLTDPDVFPDVKRAVESKDRYALGEICKKVKIPEVYIGIVTSVLFAVNPQQKWPAPY